MRLQYQEVVRDCPAYEKKRLAKLCSNCCNVLVSNPLLFFAHKMLSASLHAGNAIWLQDS